MALSASDTTRHHSLIPSFIYSSSSLSSSSSSSQKKMLNSSSSIPTAASSNSSTHSSLMIPSPIEAGGRGGIQMFSPSFYAACAVGGSLACCLTHTALTPLDVVKCNMQIDPAKYKSVSSGFGVLLKEQGFRGFFRGWVPTFLGYGAQGACKYGFYEFFKKYYSDIAGPEYATKYKTLIYLAGSASAEVIADVALCPFEAVKIRVQTQPGFARGLADGLPKLIKSEGTSGLFKGIVPLWGRQIPYTMMKFSSYENIVEMTYKHVIPTPKEDCSKPLQLAAVNKLGLWGLFTRGLPLRILMIGTLTGSQWIIYDAFKVFVGLPTTGGVAPAAVPAPATATELAEVSNVQ